MTKNSLGLRSRPSLKEADLVERRQQIAKAIDDGKSDSDIARSLHASRHTVRAVRRRLERAKEAGLDVDFSGRQRGSARALSSSLEQQMRMTMKRVGPNEFFPSATVRHWTPSLAVKLARLKKPDAKLSVVAMRRYMGKWADADAELRAHRKQLPLPREQDAEECLIWELLAWTLNNVGESPRFLRRLQPLRRWSHEQVKQVFP